MIEYKCDFCGEKIDSFKTRGISIPFFDESGVVMDFHTTYHLCKRCFRKMERFIKIQIRNGRKVAKYEPQN